MDPERMARLLEGSSLEKLLRQILDRLYEREIEVSLLIDRLLEDKNGALSPGDQLRYQELLHVHNLFTRSVGNRRRSVQAEFDLEFAEKLAEQHVLEEDLGQAIANESLSLVFEPIISSGGACYMVEALLRWTHPERGPIPASVFISLAERTGDIVEIGRWVLLRACQEALTWPGNPPPSVSVNVSPAQILNGEFVSDVFAALKESGLPAHRLRIELTENLFAGDLKYFNSVLMELQKAGIRIALDDFGTGFSSLSYLRSLQINTIKIDRSFIESHDAGAVSILRAIISMAQALGLETIAEGVETASQAEMLVSLGMQHLQGFLFTGTSLTASEIRMWLSARGASAASGG